MKSDDIQNKVIEILEERSEKKIPEKDCENLRYLDAGIIDSIGLIEFIVNLEETFDVQLDPEDTECDMFRTVGGVARIISMKVN